MLVTTAKPLDDFELMNYGRGDALINLNGWRCRYMRYSEGQTIDAIYTYYEPETKITFGLKELKKPNKQYDYIAFTIY